MGTHTHSPHLFQYSSTLTPILTLTLNLTLMLTLLTLNAAVKQQKLISTPPSAQHVHNTATTVTSSRVQPVGSADCLPCCPYLLLM